MLLKNNRLLPLIGALLLVASDCGSNDGQNARAGVEKISITVSDSYTEHFIVAARHVESRVASNERIVTLAVSITDVEALSDLAPEPRVMVQIYPRNRDELERGFENVRRLIAAAESEPPGFQKYRDQFSGNREDATEYHLGVA